MPQNFSISPRLKTGLAVMVVLAFCGSFIASYYDGETHRRILREAAAIRRMARLNCHEDPVTGKIVVNHLDGFVKYEDGQVAICSFTGSPYIWKSSLTIPLEVNEADEMMFFACSSAANSKGERCFIFPSPVYFKILNESAVDWKTQQLKK